MFYVSEYLEEHREEYVSRLRELGSRADAWNEWTKFFLTAVDQQAGKNANKARAIRDLYENLKQEVIAITRSQYAVPLLDQLFKRPVFQSSHLRFDEPRPSRQATFRFLRLLVEAGTLKVVREGSGRRGQVLALAALVNLCEGKEVI